ncbi:RNA-guided endonuclease InsQ/TnpB family protein [Streptomyces sp. NPDC059010]|uniref:RNA-guided endonuclease InsQ/TnpB family protein n=1 Tax=Streptomyces sp. NPDC059010 TaxID=3346695 RepID=UPI003693B55C
MTVIQDPSRQRKGSNNRRRAKQAVAKIHARIADRRRDFIEQETTRIVRESQAVYVEDLNVKGMVARGGRLGKGVHDQSLGRFARTLEVKCARYGRTFVRIDRWFPSTQLCSRTGCGRLTGPKGREQLNVRVWTCTECGTRHDRDDAEANLRAAGRKRVAEMRHEAERQNACSQPLRAAEQAGIAHVHVGEDVNAMCRATPLAESPADTVSENSYRWFQASCCNTYGGDTFRAGSDPQSRNR